MADQQRDPEVFIFRNGIRIMNMAHFSMADDNLHKRAKALELMKEIYCVSIDSQVVVADLLAKKNERLVPYMWYEAMKIGHVLIAKAIEDSGNLAFAGGPEHWESAVSNYRQTRIDEVFALTNTDAITEAVEKWLAEFDDEGDHLMVSILTLFKQ